LFLLEGIRYEFYSGNAKKGWKRADHELFGPDARPILD
jgi:hypothetical protein